MERRSFVFAHRVARERAAQACMTLPDGWIADLHEPTKSRPQEERYHAMIGDIAKQTTFMNRRWGKEDMKRLLIDGFVRVMRDEAKAQGKPDPFAGQGEVVPSLDGRGFVQLGVQSRGFSKSMGSKFVEYLFAYGAEHDIRWSDPTLYPQPEAQAA